MGSFQTKFKAGPPTTNMSAEELIARGYRKTSNAYGHVTRIDRPDWVEFLAGKLGRSVAELYDPKTGKPAGTWADHYRTMYSDDTHTVDFNTTRRIPTSGHDPVGFIDVIDCEARVVTACAAVGVEAQ